MHAQRAYVRTGGDDVLDLREAGRRRLATEVHANVIKCCCPRCAKRGQHGSCIYMIALQSELNELAARGADLY